MYGKEDERQVCMKLKNISPSFPESTMAESKIQLKINMCNIECFIGQSSSNKSTKNWRATLIQDISGGLYFGIISSNGRLRLCISYIMDRKNLPLMVIMFVKFNELSLKNPIKN